MDASHEIEEELLNTIPTFKFEPIKNVKIIIEEDENGILNDT